MVKAVCIYTGRTTGVRNVALVRLPIPSQNHGRILRSSCMQTEHHGADQTGILDYQFNNSRPSEQLHNAAERELVTLVSEWSFDEILITTSPLWPRVEGVARD